MEAGEIYSANNKKLYESTDPTASRWLSRFMLGTKRMMGVVIRQDEALMVDQLLFIGDSSEEYWLKSRSEEENKELDSTIVFATIAFCVSLRGE